MEKNIPGGMILEEDVSESQDDVEEGLWRSRYGKTVKIEEMDSSYLWNAIRKLESLPDKKGFKHAKYKALLKEAANRDLCLNTRPEVQAIGKAVTGMRRNLRDRSKRTLKLGKRYQ